MFKNHNEKRIKDLFLNHVFVSLISRKNAMKIGQLSEDSNLDIFSAQTNK